MTIERGAFTGTDPQGDERLREEMRKKWELESVFSELRKALPKDASVFTSIENLLKSRPKNGHVLPEKPPFVVVGIQRVNWGNGHTREIYISSAFDDEKEARKYETDKRYKEFSRYRDYFSYMDSTSGKRPDDWVDFYTVNMGWLKEREALKEKI